MPELDRLSGCASRLVAREAPVIAGMPVLSRDDQGELFLQLVDQPDDLVPALDGQ